MNKYQSYKPSGVEWIGEIPDNWRVSKFKYVSKLYTGNSLNDEQKILYESDDENHIPYVSSKDIDLNTRSVNYNNGLRIPRENNHLKVSSKDSFLLCVEGGSSGRKMVYLDRDVCFVNKLCSFKSVENTRFQFYFIQSSNFQDKFKFSLSGLIGGVSISTLRDFEIVLPTKEEQHQIVQYLDNKTDLIDKLISTKERKITLLREQRTTLINHVVTKGLNPDVKMKNSGVEWIGEIPEHWNMVSIKNLVSTKITDGPHETPEWVEEGIPFLSVESVQDNKLDFNKKRGYITEELHKIYSKKCKPQRDDIFIVKSGSTTGKSTIVETDEEFNIWSPLCIVRSNKDKILPRFFFNSIQSFYFRRFIELGWSFGTQPNIGMGVIENLKIVLPPLKEQQPVIDFLNHKIIDIDNLVDLEQKKIDLLKEYRQSLISEVVTGKIKVTN
jgi:type I restriction enzyme S subunit